MKTLAKLAFFSTAAWIISTGLAFCQVQPNPQGFSISTPRPINPAASTTNPSALATQGQNPYLGSTPAGKATDQVLSVSLREAVERGLRYNLGLIESSQGTAEVRAQRLRALSALLPNLSVKGEQAFEDISLKEIGLRLRPMPGVPALPATTGPFSYQEARVSLTQSIYSDELHNRYRAQQSTEQASALSTRDARDVVVYAVGIAYLQVVASAARVETAQAQLASARELDQQTADQLKNEVSPEIDSIRAQVERQKRRAAPDQRHRRLRKGQAGTGSHRRNAHRPEVRAGRRDWIPSNGRAYAAVCDGTGSSSSGRSSERGSKRSGCTIQRSCREVTASSGILVTC